MGHSAAGTRMLDRIDSSMDLRRKRADSITSTILNRAHWLDEGDQLLVVAMFRDGQSASAIADALDLCPRFVRRQIKQLINRLSDPRVAYVIAHQDQWTRARRSIARALFIQGRSMRETSDELGVSLYSVRRHREVIEAMFDGAHDANGRSVKTPPIRAWR